MLFSLGLVIGLFSSVPIRSFWFDEGKDSENNQ
jgi:hypothetical protein